MHPSAAHRVRQELAVAPGRVEKLPKEPQTWKTTRRVGKSFANGWRFRRTSDRQQIRPRPSPKGPSSRTSFSAAAASRTTESWDGCCRASAGRDRCRPGSRETTPAASFYRTPPSRPRASPCNHVATEPRADLSGRRTTEVLLQMAQVWQRLAETTRAAARPYPADWVVATKSGWQRATPGSFYSRPGADPHPLAQSRGFLTT